MESHEQEEAETPSFSKISHSRRFRHRDEFLRTRDANLQLLAWQSTYVSDGFPDLHRNDDTRPCPDTALAAFAQLAAIRTDCRSAVVSLFGAEREYVLAEVRKTTPLQRGAGEQLTEGIQLGTGYLLHEQSLTWKVLDEWQSASNIRREEKPDYYYRAGLSQHSYIVDDLHTDDSRKDYMIAQRMQWLRFLCAVPLRGAKGSVIGQLAIMCDRPRYGVNHDELILLEDIADTVVEHLDNIVVRAQRQVSDRHMQALNLFIAGKKSLRQWWVQQDDARVDRQGRHVARGTAVDRTDRANQEFGQATAGSLTTTSPDMGEDYFGEQTSPREGSVDTQRQYLMTSDSDEQDSSNAQLFARATNLLREALDVTGVVLVNAKHIPELQPHHLLTKDHTDSLSDSDSNTSPSSDCDLTGFSVRTGVDTPDDKMPPFMLSKSTLRRLLKHHRHGGVAHYDGAGKMFTSSDEESSSNQSGGEQQSASSGKVSILQTLGSAVPNVRSMAFLPLWDDRLQSCIIVWDTSGKRFFQTEVDLLYLMTFGQCITSEFSRLQGLASNAAKDTFLSSISHELRSPLHGILAGVEMIQETVLSKHQDELVRAVGTSGQLLLDTVEHILDYAKIGARSRSSRFVRSTQAQRGLTSSTTNVDLAELTEDIVETCCAASRIQNTAHSNGDVAVTLNIQQLPSWQVSLDPGVWIRIVTNLVGNALKYTSQGHVAIKLEATVSVMRKLTVNLEVQDSGIGMSKEYLLHNLFVPFKQENSLSAGTGLGLSIVKQLVKMLGGNLVVKSKQKLGTKIRVRLELQQDQQKHVRQKSTEERPQGHVQIVSTHDEDEQLVDSVALNASSRLGCRADIIRDFKSISAGSRLILTDNALEAILKDPKDYTMDDIAKTHSQVLVLGRRGKDLLLGIDTCHLPIQLNYLYQPIGPRKLAKRLTEELSAPITRPKSTAGAKLSALLDNASVSRKESTDSQTSNSTEIDEDKRVLLVEDNSINMKLLCTLMKKLKMSYDCAVDGQEAVDKYKESPQAYLLILMDMSMPVMDGFIATREIRRHEGKVGARPVHITALTGVTGEESRDKAFECGVSDFYSKPVQMRELRGLLQQARDRSSSSKNNREGEQP